METISGMALLINDFIAVVSFLGSLVLLIEGIFKSSRKSKSGRSPGKIGEWSVLGLIFGVIGQLSLAFTGQLDQPIGLIFRLSPTIINTLLFFSFILIVSRLLISRRYPQPNLSKK